MDDELIKWRFGVSEKFDQLRRRRNSSISNCNVGLESPGYSSVFRRRERLTSETEPRRRRFCARYIKNEFPSSRDACYSGRSGAPASRLIYGTLSKVVNKAMRPHSFFMADAEN